MEKWGHVAKFGNHKNWCFSMFGKWKFIILLPYLFDQLMIHLLRFVAAIESNIHVIASGSVSPVSLSSFKRNSFDLAWVLSVGYLRCCRAGAGASMVANWLLRPWLYPEMMARDNCQNGKQQSWILTKGFEFALFSLCFHFLNGNTNTGMNQMHGFPVIATAPNWNEWNFCWSQWFPSAGPFRCFRKLTATSWTNDIDTNAFKTMNFLNSNETRPTNCKSL